LGHEPCAVAVKRKDLGEQTFQDLFLEKTAIMHKNLLSYLFPQFEILLKLLLPA